MTGPHGIDRLDRFVGRRWHDLTASPGRRATLAGAAAVLALAVALIPLRDSAGTANVALALALIVGVAGYTAGIGAGMVVAIAAASGFTLLHAVPHGLPAIEDEQDAITAALLLGTGYASGWVHRRRERLQDRIQRSEYGYARLHELAVVVADPPPDTDLLQRAADLIREEVGLRECFWEVGAEREQRVQLNHNARLAGTTGDADPARWGEILAEGVSIPSPLDGRFVLVGDPGAAPTRRQLRNAVIMADMAVAAVADPPRGQ